MEDRKTNTSVYKGRVEKCLNLERLVGPSVMLQRTLGGRKSDRDAEAALYSKMEPGDPLLIF